MIPKRCEHCDRYCGGCPLSQQAKKAMESLRGITREEVVLILRSEK